MSGLDAQLDRYLQHLQVERGLSRHTLDAYGRDLARFSEFVAARGRADAKDVSPEDVAAWARSIAAAGCSAATQARRLVAVRGLYRHLRREGEVQKLPTEPVDLPRLPRRLPKLVQEGAVSRLLASAEDRFDRAVVALLYGAGLRVSEVVGLDLGQIHLDAGVLRVMGKGSKERIVPFGPVVGAELAAFIEEERPRRLRGRVMDAVFPGKSRRGRVSRQTIFLRLRRLGLAAGLHDAICPHALRHGFATDLLQGGADLRAVQAMLGHADLRTTEVYTHVDDRHLRRVHRAAHPRA